MINIFCRTNASRIRRGPRRPLTPVFGTQAMEFPEPRYSKRTQVARVARADAQEYGKLYLIK